MVILNPESEVEYTVEDSPLTQSPEVTRYRVILPEPGLLDVYGDPVATEESAFIHAVNVGERYGPPAGTCWFYPSEIA